MEPKKNKNSDSNQFRHSFFLVGLNYVAGITLAAFSYQQLVTEDNNQKGNRFNGISTVEEVEKEVPPKIEIPKSPLEKSAQKELNLTDSIITIDNRNIEDTATRIILINIDDPITPIITIVEPVVDFPDIEASFNGGEAAMQQWMQQNLNYPEISIERGDKGKVYLKFIVEKDGSITNVEIIQGISRELDNEAKRLIRTMPEWVAGETKGLKVRSSFTMPIYFEFN